MSFIPHTEAEVTAMLQQIGVKSIADLFDEIPRELKNVDLSAIALGASELEVFQQMEVLAHKNKPGKCFIGAGAYEHHIPAAAWDVASRGEFMTAYTPYQAEASQGTLQLIYEFQTMMTSLLAMDVANASLYDGASALAEAVLMAVRSNTKAKSKKVLLAATLHPAYISTVKAIVKLQGIDIIEMPLDFNLGKIDVNSLKAYEHLAAVVIPQPNFFGNLEDVHAITNWAHDNDALVVAVVNPLAAAMLVPPGKWGNKGADIACGEGQPLGVPLAGGGPYYGFLTCKMALVRQMPGRIVGRTVDSDGKEGFALTLQAREQHIRRSKARSNICTNQGLLVTASTIYMALLGDIGLKQVAKICHHKLNQLLQMLQEIPQVSVKFSGPMFHEAVITVNANVKALLSKMAQHGINAGVDLGDYYAELQGNILLCVTETKTEQDLIDYKNALETSLQQG